jgi:hypothetical protein
MTDELKKRMQKLRAIAPRLNSATDQASRLVAMVEKFLVDDLHIGVSAVSSPFSTRPAGKDEHGNPLQVDQALAFGRVGGSYRIHVLNRTGSVDGDGRWREITEKEEVLWPSCGRDTKLKAFEKLPELLDGIISEAERLASAADATAAKVREITSADEEPVEAAQGRAWASGSGPAWGQQLADAARRYHHCERDVVESELDSDAWEARMEAEGREDADPHSDWETAREKLIRLVCIATGHDPAEPLDAPICAMTGDWLIVVSPGRDDPWDDEEDADHRRLSVISRTDGLSIF